MTLEPVFDLALVAWPGEAPAGPGLVPAIVQDGSDGRVLMLAWVDRPALDATMATGEVHFHSRSRDRLWRKGETSGNVLRLRSIELDCDGDALLLSVDPVGPTCHRGTRSCFALAAGPGPALRAETGAATGAQVPAAFKTAGQAASATSAATSARTESEADALVPAETGAQVPAGAGAQVPAGAGARVEAAGPQGFEWLETLWATIADRVANRPASSYTTSLLGGGVNAAARKVTEEATEVLMAAKDDAVAEAADALAPARGAVAPAAASPRAEVPRATEASRVQTRRALSNETADLLFHTLVLLAERGLDPAEVINILRERHAPASQSHRWTSRTSG